MAEAVKVKRRRSKPEAVQTDNGCRVKESTSEEAQPSSGRPQADRNSQGTSMGVMRDTVAEAPIAEQQGLGQVSETAPTLHPEYKDQVWNCAFVSAQTADGQPIEVLTILDGYTLECLSICAARIVSLEDFIDRLFDLFVLREVPKQIVLRGVPGLISRALAEWLIQLPVETTVTTGSRSQENGTGAFSAKLRDEVIGSQAFTTLPEARALMASWRRQYNETRPQHSPLEDEDQASQDSDAVISLEAQPTVLQTLPPRAEPEEPTEPAANMPEKSPCQNGWRTRVPKWVVYASKAAECVGIILVVSLMTMVVMAMLAPHFGWRADTVLSGSMEPALPVGCVQVTRPVNTEDITVGDIITFRSPTNGKLMSHRVAAVQEGETYQFRTKGDANEDVDPYLVPAENVVGRVCFKVAYVGRIVEYLKTPLGFIMLGLIGIALIVAEMSTMLEVRWKEASQADTKSK